MTFGFAQEIALTQLRCAAPFALRRVCSLGERAERCGTLSSSLSSRPSERDRCDAEAAKRRPGSLDEMASIYGVGAVKLEKYGRAFPAVMRDAGWA